MPPADRLRAWLGAPVDAAGFIAFRVVFGVLLALVPVRMVVYEWVEPLFLAPTFRFGYAGFGWVPRPSAEVLYGLLALQFVAGLLLAAGVRTRLAALAYFLAFTWVELIDQATYLNHYYFVSLVTALLVVLPVHGRTPATVPRWALVWLKAQVGVVYFYAGVAKLGGDWLLRGEPLYTWLSAMTHLPVVGPLMAERWLAIAMSWGGCIYDLTIVGLLLWRPTRKLAWAAVVFFHVVTWSLFPIGVFPWVMIASSTLFFEPDWPRRLLRRPAVDLPAARPAPTWATLALGVWVFLQVTVPLRGFAMPGTLNWTERGFRFSWRVMLIEKTGLVDFRVVDRQTGRTRTVYPADHLSPVQHRLMRTQPDMIAQYARHLAHTHQAEHHTDVAVYADAFCSLNGRPTQRLIDPEVDLSVPESALPDHWIVRLEPQR